jgi:hypothetical protein
MSVIAGLKAKDGYLFVTNNVPGDLCNNGDIVKLGKYCGALIVTRKEQRSKQVRDVLNKYLNEKKERIDGLSDSLINELILFLKMEFQRSPLYKSMPLPFLLLIIGISHGQQERLEYVFIRNRVKEVVEEGDTREFITAFDINPPVPVQDIFFGESNIIQYLSQQLPCRRFSIDVVKLLTYFSIHESQQTCLPNRQEDNPLSRYGSSTEGVKMACLSAETGFRWIDSEEIRLLADNARKLDTILTDGLNSFLFRKI